MRRLPVFNTDAATAIWDPLLLLRIGLHCGFPLTFSKESIDFPDKSLHGMLDAYLFIFLPFLLPFLLKIIPRELEMFCEQITSGHKHYWNCIIIKMIQFLHTHLIFKDELSFCKNYILPYSCSTQQAFYKLTQNIYKNINLATNQIHCTYAKLPRRFQQITDVAILKD